MQLAARFAQETVANPYDLASFNSADNETAISRFKDGFYKYHNPIYFGHWATEACSWSSNLIIIDAEHEFCSSAMGGSRAIARCLLSFRLFRHDGHIDAIW